MSATFAPACMNLPRLDPASLPALRDKATAAAYDRGALAPGIVHLGIGAFARAHLAIATEAAIMADPARPDLRWGIVGVSLRQADTRDALAPQRGLYTVAVRDADTAGQPRQALQVVGCLTHLLVAPEDPAAVLEALAHPQARIASLTVTEKGYLRDPAGAGLWWAHPDIAHDLGHPQAPRSALGFIVHALALRRQRGLGPLTLMSLDNLPANGRTLQGLVLALAATVDPDLAGWIQARCTFPDSMVDRIVPRTTDADRDRLSRALGARDAWPVMTEPFIDWAVEDRFAAGRPDWNAGGARFVAEAAPWERLKLRMVNGSHSAIAYLGAMAGWDTVDRAINEPALRAFVQALLRDEVAPTLPALPGLDVDAYGARLITRFANPALAHRTQQIAMDGTQKLPQRLLATVRERLAGGAPITRLALAVAAWLHYLRGVDEAQRPYPVEDPLAGELAALHSQAQACASAEERARLSTRFRPVFGDLADHPELVAELARALQSLEHRGVRATLENTA